MHAHMASMLSFILAFLLRWLCVAFETVPFRKRYRVTSPSGSQFGIFANFGTARSGMLPALAFWCLIVAFSGCGDILRVIKDGIGVDEESWPCLREHGPGGRDVKPQVESRLIELAVGLCWSRKMPLKRNRD